jgi:hypothetical protein
MRAATSGVGSRRRGYDPHQPRVPAGDPDGGQWTRTGGVAAQRIELTPEQVARLKWAYLPHGGSLPDAFAYIGQRIDPGTARLHHDRARMDAPLSSDRLAGSGDDASIHLLPLTDVDSEYGWTPEPDYVASRGRGGPRHYSPLEQLRIDRYDQALRNVRRFDPGYLEMSNSNSVPSEAAIARLNAEAVGLARTHSYFAARGISLGPHALRSISDRPNRGISPETALHAYNTGRVFYDPPSGYFIRRDS